MVKTMTGTERECALLIVDEVAECLFTGNAASEELKADLYFLRLLLMREA